MFTFCICKSLHFVIFTYITFNFFSCLTFLWFFTNYAGHFLPEEDDKFLERVQAAVEEEEREASAAVETDAAKDAIATAEESRKAIQNQGKLSKGSNDDSKLKEIKEQIVHSETEEGSGTVDEKKSSKIGQISGGAYDPLANLPIEFYHYYHGSNNDMGTLIEVISTILIKFYISCKTILFFFVSLEYIPTLSTFLCLKCC